MSCGQKRASLNAIIASRDTDGRSSIDDECLARSKLGSERVSGNVDGTSEGNRLTILLGSGRCPAESPAWL
jgi:hypothetical protein